MTQKEGPASVRRPAPPSIHYRRDLDLAAARLLDRAPGEGADGAAEDRAGGARAAAIAVAGHFAAEQGAGDSADHQAGRALAAAAVVADVAAPVIAVVVAAVAFAAIALLVAAAIVIAVAMAGFGGGRNHGEGGGRGGRGEAKLPEHCELLSRRRRAAGMRRVWKAGIERVLNALVSRRSGNG